MVGEKSGSSSRAHEPRDLRRAEYAGATNGWVDEWMGGGVGHGWLKQQISRAAEQQRSRSEEQQHRVDQSRAEKRGAERSRRVDQCSRAVEQGSKEE